MIARAATSLTDSRAPMAVTAARLFGASAVARETSEKPLLRGDDDRIQNLKTATSQSLLLGSLLDTHTASVALPMARHERPRA